MVGGRPLFPGSTVEDELHLIFKILGTPSEKSWPGVLSNKDFEAYNFPAYPPVSFVSLAPRMDSDGVKLLAKLLRVCQFCLCFFSSYLDGYILPTPQCTVTV